MRVAGRVAFEGWRETMILFWATLSLSCLLGLQVIRSSGQFLIFQSGI